MSLVNDALAAGLEAATSKPVLATAAGIGATALVIKNGKSAALGVAGIAAGAAAALKVTGPDAALRFRGSLNETLASEDRKLTYQELANRVGMQNTPFMFPEHKIFIINNFVEGAGEPALALEAWLPEQVSMDVSAQYEPLFGDGVFNDSDVFSRGARLFGFTGVTRAMSYKTWRSSSGITMQIPIVFALDDTTGDRTGVDIMDQILALKRLCLPSQVSGQAFLSPPGSPIELNPNLIEEVSAAAASAYQNVVSATSTAINQASTDIREGNFLGIAEAGGDIAAAAITGVQSIFEKVAKLDRWTSVYIGNFLYFDKVIIDSVSTAFDMQFDARGKPIKATVNLQFTTLFDPTVQDLNSIFLKGYERQDIGTTSANVYTSNGNTA